MRIAESKAKSTRAHSPKGIERTEQIKARNKAVISD